MAQSVKCLTLAPVLLFFGMIKRSSAIFCFDGFPNKVAFFMPTSCLSSYSPVMWPAGQAWTPLSLQRKVVSPGPVGKGECTGRHATVTYGFKRKSAPNLFCHFLNITSLYMLQRLTSSYFKRANNKIYRIFKSSLIQGRLGQLVLWPISAQVMILRSVSSSPAPGSVLAARSLEPASESVSLSLSAPPLLVLCLFLSLKNKCLKTKKKVVWFNVGPK